MAYITVQFADNILGHCHVNWLAPMKTRLVMLGGSRRLAVYDDNLVTEKVKIYDKGISRSSIEGLYDALVQYRNGDMYAPAIENSEALGREIKHFNHCIQHSSTPITDGKAGLKQLVFCGPKEQPQQRHQSQSARSFESPSGH
jgi:hypothetical protein